MAAWNALRVLRTRRWQVAPRTTHLPLSTHSTRTYRSISVVAAALLATLAACVSDVHTISSQRVGSSPDLFDTAAIRHLIPVGDPNAPQLSVDVQWSGDHATATLRNLGSTAVPVHDIVLFDWQHDLPGDTAFYGEGFQMLSQTAGTIANPVDLEQYTDRGHYQLPEPAGYRSVYGVALFSRNESSRLLVGFASCRRFVGRIDVSPTRIRAVIDGDGVEIAPGESWPLEDLVVASGPDRDELLARLSYWIERNHPRRAWPSPPRGWCSWYCFGPDVTAKNVLDNADVIAKKVPKLDLEFVQIDDGYQPAMGDWLEPNPAFGDLKSTIEGIQARGLEPAIWLAPFIASPNSKLFREHPDWFVKDDRGQPLRSDTVGFGGWRQGPWYCLDGTHPDAQQHLRDVFTTLQRWGIRYFKLDALYWGAIRGGHFHDPGATRVTAYREGLAAMSLYSSSFVLGCNHPLWPSLGSITGSRSSMDADRSWESTGRTGRQNLMRAWQNSRLWWNDTDCFLISNDTPAEQVRYQTDLLRVCGGLIFSGDDLTKLTPYTHQKLLELLALDWSRPPEISDDGATARRDTGRNHTLWVFNPTSEPMQVRLPDCVDLPRDAESPTLRLVRVPPRSVRSFFHSETKPRSFRSVIN